MADTIYNWGRERVVYRDGVRVKMPNQLAITNNGLKPSDVAPYEAPVKQSNRSRGTYEYDPLGGYK